MDELNRLNDRKRSLLQIIDLLRLEGEITQSRLRDTLQLQGSTVSYLVNDLKKMGVIVNTGEVVQSSGPGKPGSVLQLSNELAQFIGLHVEGDRIHSYVVGLDGRVLDYQVISVAVPTAIEEIVTSTLDDLVGSNPAISGVGIAMKGLVLKSDRIQVGPRSGIAPAGWTIQGFLQRLRERYSPVPVLLENDANCVALLYQHQKQRSDMDLILYLLNEDPFGIGCSILQHGALIKGARGAAGQYYEKDSRFVQPRGSTRREEYPVEVFVTEMMHHVATAGYLLDPEEIVLAGSLFDRTDRYDVSGIDQDIEHYQLPMDVLVKPGSESFNPGMGAALIATNSFVLETISKVGAR